VNDTCKRCQQEIKLMCRRGTDYCCEVCEKLARKDGDLRENWIKK
jgi:hypothetical protein